MSNGWPQGVRPALVLACLLVACGEDPEPVPTFAFVRPKDLSFACYDTFNPVFDGKGTSSPSDDVPSGVPNRLVGSNPRVLRMECCELKTPPEGEDDCGYTPRLHGLVTQTRRGEVGAVNVRPGPGEDSVIDGNPVIPGFTFTDVGELPKALVIPRADLIVAEQGPRWSYVASAGERQVRAVATCRYRLGVACGPESQLPNDQLTALTRVDLPSAPVDMIEDTEGYLWLSLPNEEALGRIRLNDGSSDMAADGSTVDPDQPFLPGPDGKLLELFPLDRNAPDAVSLTLVEDRAYTAWCGLGSDSSFEGDRIIEPLASVQPVVLPEPGLDGGADGGTDGGSDGGVDSGADGGPSDGGSMDGGPDAGLDAGAVDAGPDAGADASADAGGMDAGGPGDGGQAVRHVIPARLRYDADSKLLLASDLSQPLIHAFRVANERPEPIASIATGATIRDFALTKAVPAGVELYAGGSANLNSDGKPNWGPNDTRYIYAIDDADGSVLAIRWTPDSGVVELVQPQGAVPYGDRLAVPGVGEAIEIIDTRGVVRQECGGDAEDRQANAGTFLRGVFAVVAMTNGRLHIIDVHDQDLFCEAFGKGNGQGRCRENNQVELDPEGQLEPFTGLAVRRHSPRFDVAFPVQADASGDDDELTEMDCPAGYLAVDEEGPLDPPAASGLVCVNADPWLQVQQNWQLAYEGLLPGFGAPFSQTDAVSDPGRPQGGFTKDEDDVQNGRATFAVSPGTSVCARGVMDADTLQDGYRGDFLVLPFTAPPGAADDCNTDPTADSPRFRIVEAYDDRLIVADEGSDPGDREAGYVNPMDLEKATSCFGFDPDVPDAGTPDAGDTVSGFTPFGVQVGSRHLATGSVSGYLHRVKAGDDGRCVIDDALDERLRARVEVRSEANPRCSGQNLLYNPYLAFCPIVPTGDRERTLLVSVGVEQTPRLVSGTTAIDPNQSTLPVALTFLPAFEELYVVDSAEQGLIQYSVRPFDPSDATNTTVFR